MQPDILTEYLIADEIFLYLCVQSARIFEVPLLFYRKIRMRSVGHICWQHASTVFLTPCTNAAWYFSFFLSTAADFDAKNISLGLFEAINYFKHCPVREQVVKTPGLVRQVDQASMDAGIHMCLIS